MEATLKVWKTNRSIYLNFLEKYSIEQLNKIPEGFNNNIIWNIAHVVAIHQSLLYKGSNLPMNIENDFFEKYKPGSKPAAFVEQEEIDLVKNLLVAQIKQTEEDLEKQLFKTYNERVTLTGFHLSSISDALEFNNFHEGMHLGMIMNLRKLV